MEAALREDQGDDLFPLAFSFAIKKLFDVRRKFKC